MSKMLRLYSEFGESTWLDYVDRNLVTRGGLKTLIDGGLRGVTSNPTIFHSAITGSGDYDDAVLDLMQADHEIPVTGLYEWLTVQDVQMAADLLRPVYDSSGGTDGFVSLEVSPHLAYESEETIEAARHLWQVVGRPNLMIKVPATIPGLPAVERLIAEGINVNVTLLFSITRYKEILNAYLTGLKLNPHPERVASVASFFVSRVDTKVDAALDAIGTPRARELKGRIALANARMAYGHFREFFASPAFEIVRRRGARPQRPLWASTSTKNPDYSDVLYVEQLIGSGAVATLTPDTLDAFEAHGSIRATLEEDLDAARSDLHALDGLGINLARITDDLEHEGVRKFADDYDRLLAALKQKRQSVAEHYADSHA